MRSSGSRDLMVGSFAALGLAILAFAVLAVGGEQALFSDARVYRVVFPDTGGLRAGSPVKISGVQVGAVRRIDLPTDPEAKGIEVRVSVADTYAERVRADSRAAIRVLQLLSGEKYVEITPGAPEAEPLESGSLLPVVEEIELLERGQDIAENLTEVTGALSQILGPLQRGEGLLGELLHDPEFGKEGLGHLKGSLANLEALTSDLLAGRGLVGRAIRDDGLATSLDDLAASIERLARLTEAIDRGDGAIGPLLEDDGPAEEAILALRDAAVSFREVSEGLRSRDGLVGRLIYDREYADSVTEDLRATLAHVAEITRKIDAGEGSLGALVNDPTLYDSAEDVVAGVNDSKFARWLIKHYRKRGIKQRTAAEVDSRE